MDLTNEHYTVILPSAGHEASIPVRASPHSTGAGVGGDKLPGAHSSAWRAELSTVGAAPRHTGWRHRTKTVRPSAKSAPVG